MKIVKLHLFDAGYCLNIGKMVAKNEPFKVQRFYALVGLIEHPDFGPILFDTGYSQHVLNLCKRLPYSLYSLATPVRFEESQSTANQLKKFGYTARDIKHVIVSHFHPDHIGGLKDFPAATFHYPLKSYHQLKKMNTFRAFQEVFFKDLVPSDIEERSKDIYENPINIPFQPFTAGFDLFNDGSLIAVDLPGHAIGQFGILLKTEKQHVFLASDACWKTKNYEMLDYPHLFARMAITDYPAFCETLQKLHQLKKFHDGIEIIPSHCDEMWTRYVQEKQTC